MSRFLKHIRSIVTFFEVIAVLSFYCTFISFGILSYSIVDPLLTGTEVNTERLKTLLYLLFISLLINLISLKLFDRKK